MKKRFISLFTILCVAVSLMPSIILPAAAETSVYGYGTNVLQNPSPTSNDYWELEDCSYGKYLNLGKDEPYIFGAKQGTNIAARQTITLTDEDVIRANNGELTLSASGKFYAQGSRSLTANLNIICYNSSGAILATYNDRYSEYSISGRTKTLSIGESLIPAGTSYIVYEGTEVLGSGNAFFGMYDFSMIFFDKTTPTVKTTPYLYAVNDDTNLPAYVVPENKITYAIDFSEAVTVSAYPTIDLSIESDVSYDITYSEDRQTVYFTTALPNTGTNTNVQLKKISGLYVKDDAGNECSYTDESLSVGNLSYKSVFDVTNSLTNLSLSGNATVRYKRAYSATLTPTDGYKLPDSITVKVNGSTITDYNYNSSTGQILVNSSAVTGNIEITATAPAQTYTITFDMQGGSGGTGSIDITYLNQLSSVTPPTRNGYTFGGYYTEKNGGGTQYYQYDGNSGKIYDKTTNITLYAKWTPKEYSVTLDAQGGTNGGTVTATYDADMPEITKPTKKGYTFNGYYTQPNGAGEKYYNADGTSARKYDRIDGLVLYAAWIANEHTVTLDMQSGSGGTASVTATYDQAMPSIKPPTREGYTFGGYFDNTNGEGNQYYYANGTSAKTFEVDSDLILYAKWTPNIYDVVIDAQGGSGSGTVTATYDSEMPVIALPDKPGYIFGGYFSEKNGGGTKYYNEDCTSSITYKQTEGITLYAYWTPITYNIQLYSMGENVGTLTDVTYGELSLPSAESLGISYANHNFVGWNIYDEQNWAMYIAGQTYSTGLVTEQGKTAYVYAAWLEKDKYTVTYDANGGGGAPAAVEVHVDETITLSSSVPSRENYTFIGWSQNSGADTAQYQPGDSFTMGNSLVTLFAVWKKNPELSYNSNGGVFSTYVGVSYPTAGSSVNLTSATPQKEGYIFRGWAERENAAIDDIISSPYTMPDRDTVLYAVYEPIKYEVRVSEAAGYSVNGISADGYTIGEYAEFTVSGANPKVYINGIRVMPEDGKYKFEVSNSSSIIVSDSSSMNVIYSANGGVNAPVDMKVYANGDTAYITSQIPTKTGYTFKGWTEAPNSRSTVYNYGDSIAVSAEDIVLYALWEPVSYTVKYDSNGGNGYMTQTTAVYDEAFKLSENTFTKEGCQFIGWSYSENGEMAYANGASVKNLSDTQDDEIILYAMWKSAKTKVLFDFDGGYSGTTSCEVEYGNILPTDKLIAPIRYGFTFAGYYTEANKKGNLVYNEDMSLSDYYKTNPWDSVLTEFNLYAAWEPVKYNVSFISETGAVVAEIEAVYGEAFTLPEVDTLDISVPEGYSFRGWSVAPGSNTVYYSDGQKITTGLTGENDVTVYLYAVILENESYLVTLPASGEGYHVYYDGNELTAEKNVTVTENENISFSITVDDGYSADEMTVLTNGIILGATEINGSTYSYSINNISADTSVNIYNVNKEKFNVILNDGTGYTVSPKNITVESGNDFSFSVTLKDGYKTSIPDVYVNGQLISGTKNENIFTYTVTDVTMQPVISISVTPNQQHTVTFVSNGSIYLISTVEEGMQVSQPSAPDRNGYTFGGWYTDIECNNPYDFQTEITDSITLYAKWTADTYTVEYDKNTTDDVSVPDSQTKNHDTVLTLSSDIPTRTGYTFTGWNTKADGTGTSYIAGGELSINNNITLYAQWQINRYAVSLVVGDGVSASISASEAAHGETVKITAVSTDGHGTPVVTAIPKENAELVSDGVYKITGPVSFVAMAEAKGIYTAKFYHNGGLYYTQSAIEGSADTIILPNPPEKQGYTFMGWFTEQTGGEEINESTVLDKDMSVYAQFTANTLTVTLPQSGSGYTVTSNDDTNVAYGGSYTFTITATAGNNIDNIVIFANGMELTPVSVSDGVIIYTISNITENITVSIRDGGIDTYTITYHSATSEYVGNMPEGQIKEIGNSVTLSNLEPQRYGYTFEGWATEKDGEVIYMPGAEYTADEDVNLYAVWTPVTYTVTYELNGGNINSGEINEYVYSVGAVLPSDVTKDGFDFIGWYDNEFLEGVRVTEITPTDSGDKKYYARYSLSSVVPNGYEGEYDGSGHILEYTLVDELTVQSYQWYFKADSSNMFIPVQSESAFSYTVCDVSDSGEYYCYVEALQDGCIVRFNTGAANVNITKKPLLVKAKSAQKTYDTLPLTSKEIEFTDETALVSGHIVKAEMTETSTITNAGTVENNLQNVTVYDADNNDVTANYEIQCISGTLTVNKLPLSVEGNTVSKYKNASVAESELYKISGVLSGETLSLDNTSFVITNSKGEVVNSLSDITKENGTYTITITFNGFAGDGCENYTGSGNIISNITVSSRPSGGGSSGGSSGGSGSSSNSEGDSEADNEQSKYVVSFDTNGAEKIDSVTVIKNQKLNQPEEPTKEGYTFGGWYTDRELTTAYDFSLGVTESFVLYAKWTKTDDNNDNEQYEPPFDDVEPDKWYYTDIGFVVENGIFNGITDEIFGPEEIITRAMLVTVLYRVEGEPEVTGTATFEDIDKDGYYAEAIVWGQQNGIIKGYSDTEFAPDQNITREQIAAIMHRYAKYKGIDTTEEEKTDIYFYTDYDDISGYAIPSVQYVVGSGLMQGKTAVTFHALDNATRAEIAAILHRFVVSNN